MCDISCSKIKAIYKTPRCNLLLGLTCTSQDMESHRGLPQVSHSSLNGVGGCGVGVGAVSIYNVSEDVDFPQMFNSSMFIISLFDPTDPP